MNDCSLERLSDVAKQFSLGSLEAAKKLENGLINCSFLLETTSGRYVAQALNTSLWDERVIADYESVQRYLRTSGLFVPVLLASKQGSPAFRHGGVLWRCFEYIPNDTVETPTPDLAREAGALLGRFHALMAASRFRPTFSLLGFHDTPEIRRKMRVVSNLPQHREKRNEVAEERAFLEEHLEYRYLPRYLKPHVVIHGDPKLDNFLFKENKAIALLDLDTMMRASPLIDIGDALRSWCRKKPSTPEFMPDVFEAAYAGYCSTAPYSYGMPGVKSAMGLLTLELAARYLTDYFEESYFSHVQEKYVSLAEQNLTRARRYIQYYRSFITYAKPYERDE